MKATLELTPEVVNILDGMITSEDKEPIIAVVGISAIVAVSKVLIVVEGLVAINVELIASTEVNTLALLELTKFDENV